MSTLSVETDVAIPVRDATVLRATVLRPSGSGRHPAVVMRTAYDRTTPASTALQVHAVGLATAGYAVVLQDVRGRWGSDGEFAPFVHEQADGLDTIDWVAGSRWCNGRVATAGISYNAFAQTAAAIAAPEALAAWVPGLAPCDVRTDWIRRGGALDLGFHLAWGLGGIAPVDSRTVDPAALLAAFADPIGTARRDGHDHAELAATRAGSWFFDWLADADPYGGDRRVPRRQDLGAVRAPALVVAGWYDVFAAGSIELISGLRSPVGQSAGGPNDATSDATSHGVRDRHRLVAGPWGHSGLPLGRRAGDRDFGVRAAADLHTLQLAWFDQHLRGADQVTSDRVFVTGRNEWSHEAVWPPSTEPLLLYLGGDGSLTEDEARPVSVTVDHDPGDPPPASGGAVFPWEPALRCGAFDQRTRQARDDVLVFRGPPLSAATVVAGRPTVRVRVEGPSEGSIVSVTLNEQLSDGRVWNLADGVARLEGSSGEVVVELGPLTHEFGVGTTLVLDVAFAVDIRLAPQRRGRRTLHLDDGSGWVVLPVEV